MSDPKTIIIAFISGIVPALIWLWFWLKEDKENPEPKGLIAMTFILGMLSVLLILPLEKFAKSQIVNPATLTIVLSIMEEVIKYLAAVAIAIKSHKTNDPVDFAIHMITAALGFAALENTLFLIEPIALGQTAVSVLTGNLRFIGATLLHATASSFIGIGLGLALKKSIWEKRFYLLGGFSAAITLHTIFNFYIMKAEGVGFLQIFAFLWVTTILSLLMFEKLRRIGIKIKENVTPSTLVKLS